MYMLYVNSITCMCINRHYSLQTLYKDSSRSIHCNGDYIAMPGYNWWFITAATAH